MKDQLEKFDSFLKEHGLKRIENGFGGGKLIIVGIEGSNINMRLALTYHDNVFIEEFNGSIEFIQLHKLLLEISEQIKKLQL